MSIRGDAWLSQTIGCPTFELLVPGVPTDHQVKRLLGGLPKEPPVLAYAKIPTDRAIAVDALMRVGFSLIETQVNLAKHRDPTLQQESSKALVRPAHPSDRTVVTSIARRSFSYSRFHSDPLIPTDRANEVKAAWAANYFEGRRGDSMVVAIADGVPVGFVQLLSKPRELVIDLIAVDPAHQGSGLATQMIRYVESELAPDRLRVGTQITNLPSLRLYEGIGFRIESSAHVLHFHSARGR